MHTLVVGISHKTAAVALREKMHFPAAAIPSALKSLREYFQEALILSTCNRVEIYTVTDDISRGFEQIKDFIADFHKLNRADFEPSLYQKHCEHAVEHLLNVTSSIDSMVIGENQILGQVKQAYECAVANRSTGSYLNRLFQNAVQIGKLSRSSTAINNGSISVASVAVSLVREIIPKFSKFSVLIVGAGEIAEAAAAQLCEFGEARVTIANRSAQKAIELAQRFNAEVTTLDELHSKAVSADIIIVSTSADGFLINFNELASALKSAPKKVRLFIDLCVPRNIDPAIKELDDLILAGLDELKEEAEKNQTQRSHVVADVKKITSAGVNEYREWYTKQKLIPTLNQLHLHFDEVFQDTLAKAVKKNKTVSSETQNLFNEIFHNFLVRIEKEPLKHISLLESAEEIEKVIRTLNLMYELKADRSE